MFENRIATFLTAVAAAALAAPLPADAGRRREGVQHIVTIGFRDAACPSLHAPATCSTGSSDTCHEAHVTGGPAEGCVTATGSLAEYRLPEDGPDDGGTSRAWSFAVRPTGRDLEALLHPETTGSVRVTSDGAGAPGSRVGASDEAHLRLSFTGSDPSPPRLLVLRWFTGDLPSGAEARLRLATSEGGVLLETLELPGPAREAIQLFPVTWTGLLDVTMSASVTAPRDAPVPSADLLWRLAVLRPDRDADADGFANDEDPHPLDRTVPAPPAPSSRPRVLVIGIDGAGWDVLDVLLQAGRLPTIGGIVAAGVRAPLDETGANPNFCCFCPPVWSALGCGQPESVHQMHLVQSEPWDRPVPAVWRILAANGGTTTHVSYRNTFPAEPGTTYNLSEPGLDAAAHQVYDAWPALPERGEGMNRLQGTWPPLLFETLGILPTSGSGLPAWRNFARDRVSTEALVRLARTDPTDLTMWLLHTPDKTEHVDWANVQPAFDEPLDAAALLAQADAWSGPVFLPGPWGLGTTAGQILEVDQQIGSLLAAASYDYVMLTSDHAMTLHPDFPNGGLSGHHVSPPAYDGIFAIAGPGVVPGMTLPAVSILDVAPTLAYLLDLPVATNLPGRVVTEAFTPEHLAANPIVTTPSW